MNLSVSEAFEYLIQAVSQDYGDRNLDEVINVPIRWYLDQ